VGAFRAFWALGSLFCFLIFFAFSLAGCAFAWKIHKIECKESGKIKFCLFFCRLRFCVKKSINLSARSLGNKNSNNSSENALAGVEVRWAGLQKTVFLRVCLSQDKKRRRRRRQTGSPALALEQQRPGVL